MSQQFSLLLFLPLSVFPVILFIIYKIFKRHYIKTNYKKVDINTLSYEVYEKRKVGESFYIDVKSEAIPFISKMLHPLSVRCLKRAIFSCDDETRMMAFSLLSSLERDMMDTLSNLKNELDNSKDINKFTILYLISKLYWELVYLEISDKELEEFYLSEAEKYIKEALELEDFPGAYLIAGNIMLKKGNLDSAEEYLKKALDGGIKEEIIKPLLREINLSKAKLNFPKRSLDEVKT